MRFYYPLLPAEFVVPDAWWIEAGMVAFKPEAVAYTASPDARLVPLREVEPPTRNPVHPKDGGGFDRARLISILKGFVAGATIEAVPVVALPDMDIWSGPFRYRVTNGFHRFHAAVAAGFECLPVAMHT